MKDYKVISDPRLKERFIVNKSGEIYNIQTGRKLKPLKTREGYHKQIFIVDNNKYCLRLHLILAKEFLDNDREYKRVIHINGNKLDNSLDNLKYVSSTNYSKWAKFFGLSRGCSGQSHGLAKLTEEDVIYIRNNDEFNNKELAAIYKVTKSTISSVKNKITWTDI